MPPEECDRAKSEQAGLESAGVTADMARGAEWARANLEPERLKRVARWIELQEQILFRCPRPKPPPEPQTAGGAAGGTATTPNAKPPSGQKPKRQTLTIYPENGDAGEAPPKRPKKPPPPDAYKPPSSVDLQHAAPGLTLPPAGGPALAP